MSYNFRLLALAIKNIIQTTVTILPEKEFDVSYDANSLCKYDVYRPPGTTNKDLLPVIFMTHGGGQQNPLGDKSNSGVIANKVAYQVPRGYIVISTDYPLWAKNSDGTNNGITPLVEAQYVAKAIAHAQKNVLGADPKKFILMGHSAGAHLTALIVSSTSIHENAGMKPILGSVCLDSGALNVPRCKQIAKLTGSQQLIDLYEPFGDDPTKWAEMSPYDCLNGFIEPMMLVYSTNRAAEDEKQSKDMASKILSFGGKSVLYPIAKDHGPIDDDLGLPNTQYTTDVDNFIKSLLPSTSKSIQVATVDDPLLPPKNVDM